MGTGHESPAAKSRGAFLSITSSLHPETRPLLPFLSKKGETDSVSLQTEHHKLRTRDEPTVVIVGGAGSFGRNHRCAKRMLGRTLRAERLASVRLLQPLQHKSGDAKRRLLRHNARNIKYPLRIVVGKIVSQAVPTTRNFTNPAPLPVCCLKDLRHQTLRSYIPFASHRACVLVLYFTAPFLQLPDRHQDSLQNIHRLKPCDNNRHVVFCRQRYVF